MNHFSLRLLAWFDQHGRHDLPWQRWRTPYRVWVSEIMLQQTQVATVMDYFERFMAAFPSLAELAQASSDRVLALWAGLGYYSRARNLQRAAQLCIERHKGELPENMQALCELPGIGRSTAAAILSQAHGQRLAILDGNVKRVLARHVGISGYPGLPAVERQLWHEAESRLPIAGLDKLPMADYTQAIMDLGATICVRNRPRCGECPVANDCVAYSQELTGLLPTRKPTRLKPEKSVFVLVARDIQGRVLLEKRPPLGIWGGLWSLPEWTADFNSECSGSDLKLQLRNRGLAMKKSQSLVEFRHAFTHFNLNISPCLVEVETTANLICEDNQAIWANGESLSQLGLPAPIKKLLLSLYDQVNHSPVR